LAGAVLWKTLARFRTARLPHIKQGFLKWFEGKGRQWHRLRQITPAGASGEAVLLGEGCKWEGRGNSL